MADYDISDVVEIKVSLANGRSLIYRDTGLNVIINKIRSLRSPSARETTIIDSDDYDAQEDDPQSRGQPDREVGVSDGGSGRTRPRGRGAPSRGGGTNGGSNGYNALSVSYVAPKGGRSPMELAKEMQKKAEETTGIKYQEIDTIRSDGVESGRSVALGTHPEGGDAFLTLLESRKTLAKVKKEQQINAD